MSKFTVDMFDLRSMNWNWEVREEDRDLSRKNLILVY